MAAIWRWRPSWCWRSLMWSATARGWRSRRRCWPCCWRGFAWRFSQTSFLAVLAGAAVLCALRWSLLWTAIAVPFAVVAVAGAVLVVGGTSEAEDSAEEVTQRAHHPGRGRAGPSRGAAAVGPRLGLVLRGVRRAGGHRPRRDRGLAQRAGHRRGRAGSDRGDRLPRHSSPPRSGRCSPACARSRPGWARRTKPSATRPRAARAARCWRGWPCVAAFAALLRAHDRLRARYLTDPLTWALLAIGLALARRAGASEPGRTLWSG